MDVVGRVVLYVNGLPYAQGKNISSQVSTNRKVVKGMAPDGGPLGTVAGTPEITVDVTLYIPRVAEPIDWLQLTDAVMIVRPRDGVGPRHIFTGVFTMEVGQEWAEEGEATRKVKFGALTYREVL